ncbi:MAG: hypothetical protein ABSG59_16630 [Verrucomicrobiota bacterium]|jgi:hypothetical protein
MSVARLVFLCLIAGGALASAQTLPLPPRTADAPGGRQFAQVIAPLPAAQREEQILSQILAGNVPQSLRRLCPVGVTNIIDGATNSAIFFVTADYLGVGADDDFFRAPMTPGTAQRIADQLGCLLPTPKMVDAIYRAAEVKLTPAPIAPSAAMTTVPVFVAHNEMVRTQRLESIEAHPPGALVAGHQKDVVICAKLAASPGKVAIYGWHRTNGVPIQPLYLGHADTWVDYSHGVRLVSQQMLLNGSNTTVARVLADPKLLALLSDEGVVTSPRYPAPAPDFHPGGPFGESSATLTFDPDVTIQINQPAPAAFAQDKPVLLVFYALPNGNTIAQTIGRQTAPGDDWHFDIQHIGAQTRFLRACLTNRTLVVAFLQAQSNNWPAWRARHGDAAIPAMIARVKDIFAARPVEVALAGHSGGGSFIFGYLNAVDNIPDDVVRIAFLDSDYAYDAARGHARKLAAWLAPPLPHFLCVLAYNDAIARLDGKSFVTAEGGTWGRSHAMLRDLGAVFDFTSRTSDAGLEFHSAVGGRAQFILHQNPERKILHTVQVERNGFIHAMLTGTEAESRGYEYFGPRAYTQWIAAE